MFQHLEEEEEDDEEEDDNDDDSDSHDDEDDVDLDMEVTYERDSPVDVSIHLGSGAGHGVRWTGWSHAVIDFIAYTLIYKVIVYVHNSVHQYFAVCFLIIGREIVGVKVV